MRINQLNNRHYDTRKFDECPNFYAILANEKIIEINREKDQDTIENIHVTYNIFETLLVYTNDMSKLTDCNEWTTLVGNTDNGGGCIGRGREYRKSLYLCSLML